MPTAGGGEAARPAVDEVLGRFERADIDSMLVDVLDDFPYALGGFKMAEFLDAVQALHDLGWKNAVDRQFADPGKDM